MNRVYQTYQHTILHVGCFGVDIPYLDALVRRSKNDILADVHRNQHHLGPLGDHPYEPFKTDNAEKGNDCGSSHPDIPAHQKISGGLSLTVRQ